MPDATDQTERFALKAGQKVGRVEAFVLGIPTLRLYRFSQRHPLAYLLLAFVLGGFLVAAVTVSTYLGQVKQTVDLSAAFWLLIAGSLGGGVVMAALAIAWQRTIRPTLGPMERDGIVSAD